MATIRACIVLALSCLAASTTFADDGLDVDSIVADLEFEVAGDGDETIVFVHGYPDTMHMWDAQFDYFKENYKVARFTLPGFNDEPSTREHNYDARQMRQIIDAFIASLQVPSVILVAHDWGAAYAMSYLEDPGQVTKLVLLDVGGYSDEPPSLFNMVYMAGFASAWFMPEGLAKWQIDMTGRHLLGLDDVDKGDADYSSIRNERRLVYPYVNLFKDIFSGQLSQPVAPYEIPLLFVYGSDDDLVFHGERWLGEVKAEADCHVAVVRGGHWFMQSHPDVTNVVISEWLIPPSPDSSAVDGH